MNHSDNKRIAKNTFALYLRMFVSMGVALFTSRVILEILGIENFGVYNVVGGIVSLFGFLNTSMSGATARFLTFEIGKGSNQNLNLIFNNAFFAHLAIAILIIIFSETIGLWLFLKEIEIPPQSRIPAFWVFQCSILSSVVSITQIPYNSCIIAHEKMSAFAVIDMVNTFLKLGIVYLLLIIPGNKLKMYGILTLLLSLIITSIYKIYCIKNFKECRISLKEIKFSQMKKMLIFSGWDLYGNLSSIGRTQGISILANIFFGAIANAAIGISNQVQGAVSSFATNIAMAIKPQIIKSYANNNIIRMQNLIYFGCKIIFMLLLIIIVPIFIEMPLILKLWLKEVPEYTITICRLILLFVLFSNISIITVTGVHATGDIRPCSIINGSLYISVVPITYILYKLNYSIYIPFILNVFFVIIGGIANFYYITRYVNTFSTKNFLFKVVFRCFFIAFMSLLLAYIIKMIFNDDLMDVIYICILAILGTIILTFWGLLNQSERIIIYNYLNKFKRKLYEK